MKDKETGKNTIGRILITCGAVLILCALGLFLYNETEDHNAGVDARLVVEKMNMVLHETGPDDSGIMPYTPNVPSDGDDVLQQMPVITIDGREYIGVLIIEDLGIELPVLAEWTGNYDDLKTAPVRYSGSVYTDDLVIAGHNYKSHFNPLHRARTGTKAIFIDADNVIHEYVISAVETLEPAAIDSMINSDYDLTLFTCTYGGGARYAVRLMRNSDLTAVM